MIHIHNNGEPLTMDQRKQLAEIFTEYIEALEAEEQEGDDDGEDV